MSISDKFGKILIASEETALISVLEKFENHKFPVLKQVSENQAVYDLNYYENRLHYLEHLDEGEILFNNRIKILRKYVVPKTQDPSFYDYYTRVEDNTIEKKHGTILLVHGFGETSDWWLET